MKIIDLLNKISNGEEVPKKIFYLDKIWYWDIKAQDYVEDDKRLFNYYIVDELMDSLNEEVQEIIDRAEDEYDRLKDRVHEQHDEIERLNNIIIELRKENINLIEDNMRLRKEINLHGGKLYISDIEVKNVF